MPKKEIPEDIQVLLKAVYVTCQQEDTGVRERQIRSWRRLKLLWENLNQVWFSETAHDWRVWDQSQEEDSDQAAYDKPINIFRAYLESIIAALSVLVPPVKCYPDNADDTLDLATAKAGDKIGQLIYRHNHIPIVWLHALFIFVTEGMTAFYNYPHEDESYGTYEKREEREDDEYHDITSCPMCGYQIDDQMSNSQMPSMGQPPMEGMPPSPDMMGQEQGLNPMDVAKPQPPVMSSSISPQDERDEFQPDDSDAQLHAAMDDVGMDICPACMAMMHPQLKREKFVVTRLVGVTNIPKTRMCIEAYGGLYVKVGNYARLQKDAPYLIFSRESDYSLVVERFQHLHGNPELLKCIKSGRNAGSYNQYDQWGRLSPQYQGEYPTNVITVNSAWIRPGRFNILPNQEDIDKLKKLFPDGVKVTFANDEYADAVNESLDDHWTLTENPMSDYLHFDPLGQSLVSVQEITSDLISLTLQTIEHGIGQTFADPGVLNFNAYGQTESLPGGVFPATPKSGKGLSEAFHELRTATLSPEVMPFGQSIQSLGQISVGALPSIFGGQLEGAGGDTASGYSMSRSQALQRLQNTWKLFTITWTKMFGKVIPQFIKEVEEDERTVERDADGNFVNILITKAELEGKIGRVELEANENLPMTWSQRKDLLMNLMTTSNPKILEIINAPENVGILHEAIGLVDFFVPGEDDIMKQYDEIKELLDSVPFPNPGDPNLPEVPSVDIDVLYDRHDIEFEIVRKWATSEAGRQTKLTNEAGYKNVLLHGKLHFMQMQMMMGQQNMAPGGEGAAPNEKPNPKKQEAPIVGDSNVSTNA